MNDVPDLRRDAPVSRRAGLRPFVIALACLAAFWMTAVNADFFLDRPFLYLVPDIYSPNYLHGKLRSLMHAEVVLASAAVTFLVPAIVFAAVALARLVRSDPLDALARVVANRSRAALAAATALAMAGSSFVAFRLVKGAHTIDDENAYVFQARLFARGVVALPEPPAALANPMILTHGVWVSKYPPGHSLALALGTLLGDERAVPIAFAGGLVVCTYLFVRDAFGPRQALLAAALTALSPVVWAQYGSVMAFGTSALALSAFLAGLAASARTGRAYPAFLAGMALGFLAITRIHEAIGLGLPPIVMLTAHAARRFPGARTRLAATLAGGICVGWILLAHNQLVAGSPFRLPYQLDPVNFNFGFTPGQVFLNVPLTHTPHAAVANLLTIVARVDLWLLAWPGSTVLIVAGLLGSPRAPFDRLLAAMLGSFVLMMALVPMTGTWDFGPTYYFVCTPVLIGLAIRGARWLVLLARAHVPASFSRTVAWTPIVGAAVAWLAVAPIRFASIATLSAEVRAPWEKIARELSGDVLVGLPPPFQGEPGFAFGFPYTIPTDGGTVAKLFRASTAAEHDEAVKFLGPTLPVYGLSRDEEAFARTKQRRYSLRLIAPAPASRTTRGGEEGAEPARP